MIRTCSLLVQLITRYKNFKIFIIPFIFDTTIDLPFSEKPIETEEHALLYCPEYDNVRESAPISLLNDLKQDVAMVFNDAKATHKPASFLEKIMSHRKAVANKRSDSRPRTTY